MALTAPKTVAQAIAPFEKVKANLKAVLAAQGKARAAAQSRLTAAQRTAEQAEKTEGANIAAADAEAKQAEALIAKLDALLTADEA